MSVATTYYERASIINENRFLVPTAALNKICDKRDYIVVAKILNSYALSENDAKFDPVMKADINELTEKLEHDFASKSEI
eukprot:CAMPEP_0176342740 /NCGR_PEP_ID=MMETSP0126-20121128/3416_1 /TAXON_ID=141414 ORGANISM="Strombidinopsis acuminatum, Strain SPMC142" /NCGR_SAMPLE_ID=MMETSP0126 /ASSEMBLY_ACC=CAM_ASM_000229 /LENGTH=79 /DNA_ID=CAMNT_0017688331 /DNA_START=1723 /DNA_END=1962 /DNA_ORIENTATION=-